MAGYIPPTAICEFAPGFSPTNQPTSGDWVPLVLADGATRLRDFAMERGKRDRYEQFEPGTASFVLDNNDGQLDEFESGSLTEGVDGQTWTPIRFRLTDNDTATTSTIFTGFLTDGWEQGPPSDRDRVVTVRAVDWLGWAAQRPLPDSLLASLIQNYSPQVWWRGRLTEPRVAVGSGEVLDYGFGGMTASMYYGEAEMTDALVPGSDDPGLRLFTGAGIGTSGPTTGSIGAAFWGMLVFQISDLAGVGRDMLVGRFGSILGAQRWAVRVGITGHVAFEAGGVVATIAEPHNDGRPHLVIFDSTPSLSRIRVFTDLGADSATTVSIPNDIVYLTSTGATTDARILMDEIAWFNGGIVSIPDREALLEGDASDTSYWAADTLADRLVRVCNLADVTVPAGFFTPYVTPGSTAVGGYKVESSLADGIYAAADALMGGAFVTRDGEVQVYTYGDRSSLGSGRGLFLSNEDPLPGSYYRFGGCTRSGRKVDRVINEVRSATGAILAQDITSQTDFGVQSVTLRTNATNATAIGYAALIVATRKDPGPELEDIVLTPWGDQDLTTKVISAMELAGVSRVSVGADHNGAPAWSTDDIYVDNSYVPTVLAESWSWSGTSDWSINVTIG